ncbi:MAG: oligosaccharide flippase family protein [Saccharofermentans sp.]|nr:oligosaccharide flippase family protein [Saccharofermentans sp.]
MANDGSKKKILSNSVWVIIRHLYSMITSLTIVALIARYLGPSDYGLINYCASVISIFTTLTGLGLDNLIVSEIIRNPEKKGGYLGTALVMRFGASLISYPIILAVIMAINPGNTTLLIVMAFQALGMIFQTYEVLIYWFQIELKMKYISIAIICAITITTAMRIILLINRASVEWFALALSVQSAASLLIITFFFVKKSDVRLKAGVQDAKALLRISYNFIISSMSVIIYMHADRIILERMTDSANVGIYSAAIMLATYWQFIPTALIDSARPVILEKRKKSYEEYLDLFNLIMGGVNLISFIFAVVMSSLGWFFIYFVYGSEYLDAFIPLIILSWSSFIGISGYTRTIWITGEGYYKYERRFTVTAAVLNIALDILFIWKMGIIGAAVATLITYIYEVLIVPFFFRETRIFTGLWFRSFRMIPRFTKESVKTVLKKYGSDH